MQIDELLRVVTDKTALIADIAAALPRVIVSDIPAQQKAEIINALLVNERRGVRFAASAAAGYAGNEESSALLYEMLVTDEHPRLRQRAILSLARLLSPDDLMALVSREFKGASFEWKCDLLAAARSLPEIWFAPWAIEVLTADPDLRIRRHVAVCLAFFGIEQGMDLIVLWIEEMRSLKTPAGEYVEEVCALSILGYEPALRWLDEMLDSAQSGNSNETKQCLLGFLRLHLGFWSNDEDVVLGNCRRWVRSLLSPQGLK
jgi:HEAT repeat protein